MARHFFAPAACCKACILVSATQLEFFNFQTIGGLKHHGPEFILSHEQPHNRSAILPHGYTRGDLRWRPGDELREPTEVVGDGLRVNFELGTTRPAQSQPAER